MGNVTTQISLPQHYTNTHAHRCHHTSPGHEAAFACDHMEEHHLAKKQKQFKKKKKKHAIFAIPSIRSLSSTSSSNFPVCLLDL